MTISFGRWMGPCGMACAEAANAKTKVTAPNLIIAPLLFDIAQGSRNLLFPRLHRSTSWLGRI
jgi:hypothetical protein